MNKRAIAILGGIFILIVGTLGFVLYQKKFKGEVKPDQQNQSQEPQITDNNQPTGPVAPEVGKAQKLTEDAVISPTLFFQGNGITYFNSQGQLLLNDLTETGGALELSNKRELTIPLKDNLIRVLWPQRSNNFIAEFGEVLSPRWSFFNSDNGQYTDLPVQITSLDWTPSSDRILYVWLSANGESSLVSAKPDGTDFKTAFKFFEPDNKISVSPDGKSLLFYRTSQSLSQNPIVLTDPEGKNFRAIVKEGYNNGVLWAPDSKQFLFGRRNSSTQQLELWVGNIDSGVLKSLGLGSVVDKALWSKDGQYLYVAVPTSGSPESGLTQDVIKKIDIATLQAEDFEVGEGIDARNLFLNLSGTVLFFKNMQDQSLYYVRLE